MQTNIIRRHPSFFFIKGQEGCYFFNEGQQGCYSFYERAGGAQRPSETVWGKL